MIPDGRIGYISVSPEDTGKALVNPGMGYFFVFYSNEPKNYGSKLKPEDTVNDFPGLSTVYLRIPWSYVEPEEGKYNWAVLDTPAQRWIAKGKKIALRITCSESWLRFATPEWVKKAGAKGIFYKVLKGPMQDDGKCMWDPCFDDAVFICKLEKLLAELAKRYDGNPNVAFIDIGSYGLWGEGHTHLSSKQGSLQVMKKHVDLYVKYFKKTQLCISDDFAGNEKPGKHFPITDYALSKGVSLRDDSILVRPYPKAWFHAGMAQAFWPKMPVVLEHQHYGLSVRSQAWDENLLLSSVEEYHASYMSIHWWPHIFLNKNNEVVNRINQRLGYRIMPVRVAWPGKIRLGRWFKVYWSWSNRGVAPCYVGGFPALTLKNKAGGIVSVLADDSLNVRDLKTGRPVSIPVTRHESEFVVGLIAPEVVPGKYAVYVSVGRRDGTPVLALPLDNDDGQHRYKIGEICVDK